MKYLYLIRKILIVQTICFFCLTASVFGQIKNPLKKGIKTRNTLQVLLPNQIIERELIGGLKHTYNLTAKKGDFVRVIVNQLGIDVIVKIFVANSELLIERDTPNGSIGTESLSFIAEKEGSYRLEIAALEENSNPGKYQLKLENLRQPSENDLLLVRTEQTFSDAMALRGQNTPEANLQARTKLEEALKGFQSLGDKYREANTLAILAFAVLDPNNGEQALTMINRALSLAREISDKNLETLALFNLADIYFELKNDEKAIEFYTQAAKLADNLGDLNNEVLALKGIVGTFSRAEKWLSAIEANQQILALHRRAKNRRDEANTLNIMGVLYSNADNRKRAVEFYEQALQIFRELKIAEAEALTLTNSAVDYKALGENEKALEAYRKAFELQKGNAEKSAETLEEIVDILYTQENWKQIIIDYQTLLTIYRGLEKQEKIALTLNRLGVAFASNNERQKAFPIYDESLAIFQKLKSRPDEAQVLYNIGLNYAAVKETSKSLGFYTDAAKIYREIGEIKKLAEVSEKIVEAQKENGDFEKALTFYEEIPAFYRELKDEKNEAVILNRIGILAGDIYEKKKTPEFDKKAVAAYRKALEIFRRINEKSWEARVLKNLGAHYIKTEEFEKSLEQLQTVLPMVREIKDKAEEAETLRFLAMTYDGLNDAPKTIAFYLQALEIYRTLDDSVNLARVYNGLAVAFEDTSQLQKALENYRLAEPLFRKSNDKSGTIVVLKNIGKMLDSFREYKKALAIYEEALTMAREIKDRTQEAELLNLTASLFQESGDTAKANKYWQEAIDIAVAAKDRERIASISFTMAIPLAKPDSSKSNRETALKLFQGALEINRKLGNRYNEVGNLQGVALVYYLNNDYQTAFGYLQEALPIAKSLSDKRSEAKLLSNMMILLKNDEKDSLAIFYGKQSVNLFQQLRSSLQGEKELQQSFLKSNEETYRKLADLLIGAGRIPEAQQVLAMLKEEETSEFVRRDAKEIENLSKRADLRNDERAALEKYNQFSAQLTTIGTELSKLEAVKRRLPDGESFTEEARYEELTKRLKDANTAFRLFLDKELAAELGKNITKEIALDRALQGKLQQWGAGTVALTTVVGEDRYRVILTTPKTQIDAKTEIKAVDLNKKIFAFREALLDPKIDPRPLGRELYDILIKPIEKDLEGAEAKTLLWSLDGTLRYIPMAALFDGNQYLVQRFQNVIVTSTTRQSLQTAAEKDWRVLGAGVTKPSEVRAPNGNSTIAFEGLKSVTAELASIAQVEKSGVNLLDTAFTSDALKQQLIKIEAEKRKYNVVHFATHFRLGVDTADSFLLMGNNQALTLEEVADSPEMDLTDVELVTLSACNTGFQGLQSNQNNNGKEVDSLAQFIESRGAKAVLATLWSVADESTSLLMAEFYRLRKENPTLTKAEVLRRAQNEMIAGKLKPETSVETKKRDVGVFKIGNETNSKPTFKTDETAPFAHPYYWSPFILIGNWR